MSSVAWAQSDRDFLCSDYADIRADAWVQGKLDRADATQTAGPSQVVVVMAGQKFLAPLYQRDLVATSLGDTLRKRNAVYVQEFHRCMSSRNLGLALLD